MLNQSAFENLPTTPGVYQFKGPQGKLLYIGKARNLRSRLLSYKNPKNLTLPKRRMVDEATTITFRETETEIAALLLEASLIKQHRPPYNILMRDDKNYTFVGFTKEDFPKIFITHQPITAWNSTPTQKTTQNAELIGPFTESTPVRNVLSALRKTFPYCTCKRKHLHKRPCINAQIGKCVCYCCTEQSACKNNTPMTYTEARKIYRKNITAIKRILSGRGKAVLRSYEKAMQAAATARAYEDAAELRNRVHALERIFAHRPYIQDDVRSDRAKGLRLLTEMLNLSSPPERIEGYDISNIQGTNPVGSMVVFIQGAPEKSAYRQFIIKHVKGINDPAMIHEVLLRRLKHADWPTPDLLVIDGGKTQLQAAVSAAKLTKSTVPIVSIAKREEELYIPGKDAPTPLKKLSPHLLHLIQHIRDEAHRTAVGFHRRRRTKTLLK